jgi:hypothetical protein
MFVMGDVLVYKHKPKNEYEAAEVQLYTLLHILSVPDGNEWLASLFGRLSLDK